MQKSFQQVLITINLRVPTGFLATKYKILNQLYFFGLYNFDIILFNLFSET